MATGNLYSQLQSFKFDNSFAQVMESDRQRYLNGEAAFQKKMAERRENLFKDFSKIKADGDWMRAGIEVSNEAKKHKVQLYNDRLNNKISEEDYLIRSSEIDTIPDRYNALYSQIKAKIEDLSGGDEYFNSDARDRLAYAVEGAEIKFNPESNGFDVEFKNADGEKQRLSSEQFLREAMSVDKVEDLGNPYEKAVKLAEGVKLQTINTPLGGGKTKVVLDLNSDVNKQAIETKFEATFGKIGETNLNVLKAMGIKGGKEHTLLDDSSDSPDYKDTYNALKAAFINTAKPKEVNEVTGGWKTSSGDGKANSNKELDKFSFTLLSNEGKGEKVKKQIFYKNPDGEAKDVVGLGATYDAPDTKSKFILPAKNLEGVDQGDGRGFATSNFFIDKNTLDIYVKGVAVSKDWQQKQADGEEIDISDFKTGGKEITGYKKLSPNDADMFRAKVFKGRSVKDMYNYLEGLDKKSDSVKNEKDPLGLGI